MAEDCLRLVDAHDPSADIAALIEAQDREARAGARAAEARASATASRPVS